MTAPADDELDHARAVLARHECHAGGHDFGVEFDDDTGAPLRVLCSRPCGQGPWPIALQPTAVTHGPLVHYEPSLDPPTWEPKTR